MSWFSDIGDWISDNVFDVPELIGSTLGFIGNERTNEANAEQAQNQMNFQERMSGTSYQRAVADMKAAGLNPMLAYSAGGASTPTGAAASMTNSLATGLSTGQQQSRLNADIENLKANTEAKKSETDLNRTKAWTETANQDLITQQVVGMDIANKLAQGINPSKIAEAKSHSAQAATAAAEASARLPIAKSEGRAAGTWYGRNVMPYLPSFCRARIQRRLFMVCLRSDLWLRFLFLLFVLLIIMTLHQFRMKLVCVVRTRV